MAFSDSPVPPLPALNPEPVPGLEDPPRRLPPPLRELPLRLCTGPAPTANPPVGSALVQNPVNPPVSVKPSPIPPVVYPVVALVACALSTAAGPVVSVAPIPKPLVAARAPETISPSSSSVSWPAVFLCFESNCCAKVESTGPSAVSLFEKPPPQLSPALSSLFSCRLLPPTVEVLPVARSHLRAVNTLFCMECAGWGSI